jgi:hypothetical protein
MVSDIANVVLVHGAWADGSSWNKVIAGLRARGIASVAAPLPLTTLADDMVALFVRLFVAKHKIDCRCVSLERATEKRINARTDTFSRTREGGSPHQRYWKIPDMDVGGDTTVAHKVTEWRRTFWKHESQLFAA